MLGDEGAATLFRSALNRFALGYREPPMHTSIIPLLRCPASGSALYLDGPAEGVVKEGVLRSAAGTTYPVRQGIAYLYVDDARWAPKAREATGWVRLFRDTNGYAANADDFQMPYLGEPPWNEIAPQFDVMLDIAEPGPGTRVLDLGAGRGWAARRFAQRGCVTVAVDVVDDSLIGLGRVHDLAAHDGTQISPIVADGENLPFAAGSFDLVFCAATLHHATNLPLLLRNVGRVLRPGGMLVAINEPVIPDALDEAAALAHSEAAREMAYGINETRPHLDDYRRALRDAGLGEQRIFPWQTQKIGLDDLRLWAGQLGVSKPDDLPQRRDWLGWIRRSPEASERDRLVAAWNEYMFRAIGGTAVIVATR
jgi:SAM-dependent methyltransferase